MKNFKTKYLLGFFMLALMMGTSLISCSDDSEGSGNIVIESVSLTGYNQVGEEFIPVDSLTTVGYVENAYIIRGSGFSGTQKIYFNDFEADFNPTLVTDTRIIVTIPKETPYANVSNKLRIVTTSGSAEYDFIIGQPAPTITSFDPLAGGAGQIVTIKGTVFDNLIGVKFGTTEAEIVSSTSTEIKVKIPDGIVQAFIFVETAGGIGKSVGQFGFKFVVYDDILAPGWWVGGWGGTQNFENTVNVKRGTYAIKRVTEGWSGFQIGNGGAAIDLTAGFTAIKVSIYAENDGKVLIALNGNYTAGKQVTLTAGQYTDITVPLSEIGSPQTLNEIVIQEFSGAGNTYYIDDLGFI